MKNTTLCLCMIVKSESPIILETLSSIRQYLDYWVICDTGSTDNTPELIEAFFNKEGIKGELHRVEWKNFGYNRTQVFNLAYKKADYLWVIDADDFLVGNLDLTDLNADSYRLKYVLGSITYYRDQLFRGDLEWEYKGVLHEYPHCRSKDQHSKAIIQGDYFIQARTAGARSQLEPRQKYLADAQILEQALLVEQDAGLIARYLFYLAQSYRDAGENEKAIKWYQDRVDAGGWIEEVWYAKYQIGRLFEQLGDVDKAKLAYLDAFEYRPIRAESLYSVGKLCNIRREYYQAYLFLEQAAKIRYPQDILFVSNTVYDYEIDFELSISAYWIGDFRQSVDLCNKLIAMKDKIHPSVYEQTLKNREFGVSKIADSSNV
jgi:glycosyltransferase involved in cell wall biosynthesis